MLDGVLRFSDDWTLSEDLLSPASVPTDALFTTSNGSFGVAGRPREPVGQSGGGVFVTGCYETRPYAHPEEAYGFPEHYQTILSVTDPTFTAVTVDGVPLTGTSGTWLEHRRSLDLRTGCVTTSGTWRSPHGACIRLGSRRMASLEEPTLLWTSVEVEPLDATTTIEITVETRADSGDQTFSDEPDELARAWGRVLTAVGSLDRHGVAGLVHRTPISGRAIACAVTFDASLDPVERRVGADSTTAVFRTDAGPGRVATVVQTSGFGVGAAHQAEAVLERVASTVAQAQETGFDDALARQRRILDRFWDAAAVDVEGDATVQGAIRYSAFQVFQANALAGDGARAAKGLTGDGYQGHHLWDQEIYVGHALAILAPEAARSLLAFRHRTLPAARDRAAELSLAGAQFPWRTIDGTEASALLPGGPAQYHVNAAVAWAVGHYVDCSRDLDWLSEAGIEILVETARAWASLGHFSDDGSFRIETVTGPDEYTAMVDNNLYTNVMAAANLERAATEVEALAERDPAAHRALARAVDLEPDEVDGWRRAAEAVFVPYDDPLGVHAQDDSFLRKPRWDLEGTPPDRFPLQDHHHLLALYRHQVIKQADLVLALHVQRHRFTPEERRRAFDHYEPLTVHDSSLSAPVHAIVAADVGHTDLAWRFTCDAALTDLDHRYGTPGHGIHIAAAAGAWLAVARGFGGFEVSDGVATFRPSLPTAIDRLRFRIRFRGALIEVEIRRDVTTYRLVEGDPVTIRHGDEDVSLTPDSAEERPT